MMDQRRQLRVMVREILQKLEAEGVEVPEDIRAWKNLTSPPAPLHKSGEGGRAGIASLASSLAMTEERAKTVAGGRRRLMRSYHRLFQETAARVVRREVNDVSRAGEKYLARRDLATFSTWLSEFYRAHKEFIWRQMLPLYSSYSDLVADLAEQEVGRDADRNRLDGFVRSYAASYSGRHAGTSENKISNALQAATLGGVDLQEALEEELDGWEDERSVQIANEESVRSNNAIAVTAYEMMAVQKIMSVAFGKNCPYCDALDGKVIGIQDNYIEAGKDFKPDGAEKPLTSVDNLRHAPYHGGCDCMTVAA